MCTGYILWLGVSLSEFNNISLSHYGYGLYSNQKDSNYFLCNTQKKDNNGLKVFVEVDSSHEVGNYDPFNYEEWNNPYDIEINIWNIDKFKCILAVFIRSISNFKLEPVISIS